ncbi:MAG: hypothetical protein JEZ06_18270 [Anaerolineaceae bacterium]|nr:hypothetical protein [Anaerolineaceae bacterium]
MIEIKHSFSAKLFLTWVITVLMAAACSPRLSTPQPLEQNNASAVQGQADQNLEGQAGANVWIEFPYDGQILADKELTFVVYASSTEGVESINLSINGESIPISSLNHLSSDGSMILASIEQPWEPTEKGEFILIADAMGASSSITFCIETCDDSGIELKSSDTPTPTPEVSPTPTATVYAAPETSIELGADPYTIDAGDCTTVYWNTDGFVNVTLNSDAVDFNGALEQCLCENTVYTLSGTDSIGGVESEQITVIVNGSCYEEIDTEGPIIEPWTFTHWEDCRFFGLAGISDPSGVSSAKFYYNLNDGGWYSVWMMDLGGDAWESEVGVSVSDGMGTPAGSFQYYFEATDGNGNTSTSGQLSYTYNGCEGN